MSSHIVRHFDKTPATTIEITGSQMVLCMKLISFAWSVYDSQRPDEELDATQRSSKIEGVPGLLPFLGYACVSPVPSSLPPILRSYFRTNSFFFPSILAGPSFTYRSYISFTSHALFSKENPTSTTAPPDPTVIPPGRRRKAAKRFITGLVFLGIYSVYGGSLGMDKLLGKSWLAENGFWKRCVLFPSNSSSYLADLLSAASST